MPRLEGPHPQTEESVGVSTNPGGTSADSGGSTPRIANIVDLSWVIQPHDRWPVVTRLVHDRADGDVFTTTAIELSCHSFTHADAPRHIADDGVDVASMGLSRWIGVAHVADLSHIGANEEITAEDIDRSLAAHRAGEMVLLRTDWERKVAPLSDAYWSDAPYLGVEAAQRLADLSPRCIGFDFPQDHAIRRLRSEHKQLTATDFPTHDLLLRHGVALVEYLCNLAAISTPQTLFCALPLKLAGTDGSPVRAVAIEFESAAHRDNR